MKNRYLNALMRPKAILILILGIGVLFSSIVYVSTTRMNDSARGLLDRQLPALFIIQQLNTLFSKQEKALYEYYTTSNSDNFYLSYLTNIDKARLLLQQLFTEFPHNKTLKEIDGSLLEAEKLGQRLHSTLQRSSPDWVKAKKQLAQISRHHTSMLTKLTNIQDEVRNQADIGYKDIHQKLSMTNNIIIMYCLSILFFALLLARGLKAYAVMVTKNKRLAVIPEKSSSPILGIDTQNQITYQNSAANKLINSQQHYQLTISDLFPADLEALKLKALQNINHTVNTEMDFGDRYLLIQLHYIDESDNFILHINDITKRKLVEKDLHYQAFHSAQTGLFNLYKLSQDIEQKTLIANPFALGLIEIRRYNLYVTGHGVDFAADLVAKVSKRLVRAAKKLQESIVIYQIFEHGFAFIVDQNLSPIRLQKLCFSIEKEMEYTLNTRWGDVSIELDFGMCIYPEHGEDRSTLMQHARTALDEAAAIEHSSFVCYSDDLGNKVSEQVTLSNWLKQAIENHELMLVFQPQLDIKTNNILGLETLVRWKHNGQFISPGKFIPLAEQFGDIVPIGEWIIQNACRAAIELQKEIEEEVCIAINISPRQFRHPDFVRLIQRVLSDTGLNPHCLELEITEGVLLYNEADTIEVLKQLKTLGIMLSIDDFGTGYSSLSYLKQFPIDKLKVDQSFVKNLHSNNSDKAIVQVIIELGKSLGLKVIAEGVEELEHYNYLKSVNCDAIQGYWYSHPLPREAIAPFFKKQHTDQLAPA